MHENSNSGDQWECLVTVGPILKLLERPTAIAEFYTTMRTTQLPPDSSAQHRIGKLQSMCSMSTARMDSQHLKPTPRSPQFTSKYDLVVLGGSMSNG